MLKLKTFAVFCTMLMLVIFGYWNYGPKINLSTLVTDKTSELQVIYEKLQKCARENKPPEPNILSHLLEIIYLNNPLYKNTSDKKYEDNDKEISEEIKDEMSDVNTTADAAKSKSIEANTLVCPDKFMPKKGYPFFLTGWDLLKCSAPPIEEIITILLYPDKHSAKTCYSDIISGFLKIYSNISIILAGEESVKCDLPQTVKKINVQKDWTFGKVWNTLVAYAVTPIVLIGRNLDVYLPDVGLLERLIRVISTDSEIKIAGGAVRNKTGHWLVGCVQIKMRNYILEYEEGYYRSRNECMFCNDLKSPFATYTNILKKVPFDEKLDDSVVFENFFLDLNRKNYTVVNCPDVLFLTNENWSPIKYEKKTWLQIASKWKLNRIKLPSIAMFSYSCKEAKISCAGCTGKTKSDLIPLCCIDEIANAIHYFHEFSVKKNLRYEPEAGSVLGIVKMYDYMPWDLDVDLTFIGDNLTVFRKSASYFLLKGFRLSNFQTKQKQYFNLYSPNVYAELWGEKNLSSDNYYPEIFRAVPTMVLFHGKWIYGPANPGASARNRYGHEIFKHAHSWIQLQMKDSWTPYKAGHFMKCLKPGHHACLDQFSADGNIQFKVPDSC